VAQHDRENSFPFENVEATIGVGIHEHDRARGVGWRWSVGARLRRGAGATSSRRWSNSGCH
jgi:hypothetical protein